MAEKKIKVSEAKGRPMLHWVGKKPLDFIKSFPAQLVEFFDPTGKAKQIEIPTFEDLKDNWQNLLFHGDNKEVLGYLLANGFRGKVDLIYIDPPFDSGANYIRNVELRGTKYKEKIEGEDLTLGEQIQYHDIWSNDNYLQFMYERLLLLKELLSPNGSIYVHLDHRRNSQIRLIMDEVFGPECFQREIIWRIGWVSGYKSIANNWIRNHETILYYSKSPNEIIFNKDYVPYPPDYERWGGRPKGKGLPIEDVWGVFPQEGVTSLQVVSFAQQLTDYPTQKPRGLLKRIIKASSNPDSIILDCFLGAGTTAAAAQELGKKWIGIDLNKGAIQTSMRELQKVILEQSKDDKKNGKQKDLSGKEEKPCLSFAHYKVNDYDLQLLRTEAIELAVQHIGIQRTKTDNFFDGTLGKNLVKIIDFNHPLTLLDLQLIQDELKKRPDENRNIMIVCLGKELAVDPFIEDYNKKHPVNKIEVIELRTDKKYGKFLIHKPSQAKVSIKRKGEKAQIEIKGFISPSIIERLNDEEKLIKVKIPDFRSMIDVVLVDTDYNGKVFNIAYSDVPEKKKDLVEGKYELDIPKKKTTIAVKIIDMLGEEVLISEEI